MHSTFRRLLGAIILIAAVGGASMLALRAQADQMVAQWDQAELPTQPVESEQHG